MFSKTEKDFAGSERNIKMSEIWMYAHGGSGNHGCEAIVRSTCAILEEAAKDGLTLVSSNPQEDVKYGIDRLCRIEKDVLPYKKSSLFQSCLFVLCR